MKPLVIGVAGGTGSGKTTVAQSISAKLGARGVALLEQDSYYKDQSHLPMEERRKVNYDHPDAFDMGLLLHHIAELRASRPVRKPRYSFETYARLPDVEVVAARPVVVVEGLMVLADELLRSYMDIKLFVDAEADVRFIRRLMRDVQDRGRNIESVVHQYLSVVRPMHLQFVEPSKRYADIIIPEGGHNQVALDLIVTKVMSIVASADAS